jgi:hypothetical protein
MFDPASISAALSSIKVILDLAKNANDAQLAMKISSEIANLQGRLIDVQQQALELQNENHELQTLIRTLKDTAEDRKIIEAQLIPEDNAYFRMVDGNTSRAVLHGLLGRCPQVDATYIARTGKPARRLATSSRLCASS